MLYVYNAGTDNGQIAQAIDRAHGESVMYSYDSLKRLSGASASAVPAVQNQGFEQALSPFWVTFSNAIVSTQYAHGGTHSLSLGQGSWAAQTIAGTIPSTSYSVSVWCIVPATGSSVSLTVGIGSAATLTTSSVWTSFYASGSSDTNGNLKITLAGGSSNGSAAWCDDLTMSTVNPASPTLTWGQSFGFDGFGNLVSQTPTAGSAPRLNMTVNTATNQLTATGVQYDSNGNLINNGSSAFTFDLMGRLKTAGNNSYTYSAGENKRSAVYYPGGSSGGTMTFYLYGPDGKRLGVYQESSPNGNWNWANVSYPAPQTFQYLGGKALNYSEDRLSSNGNRYYPYGQAYNGTSQGETPTFGTYVPDQGSGMLYADQRYYNAAWGRFLTPDPSDANVNFWIPQAGTDMQIPTAIRSTGTTPRGNTALKMQMEPSRTSRIRTGTMAAPASAAQTPVPRGSPRLPGHQHLRGVRFW